MLRSQWNRWLKKSSTKKQTIRKADQLSLLQLEDRVTPSAIVYVDDDWTSLPPLTPIIDADLGTAGDQNATIGVDAFSSISAALSVVTSSGTIIVNGGTYAESISLSGTQTLEITGPDTPQAVTISALTTAAGQNVIIEGSSTLTVGDSTSTTIAGVITGTGSLIKQGSGILTLSGNNTFSGGTILNMGTLAGNAATGVNPFGTGSITLNGGILAVNNNNILTLGADSRYVTTTGTTTTTNVDFATTPILSSPPFQTDAVPASGTFDFKGSGTGGGAYYSGAPTTNFAVEWNAILTIGTAGLYTFNPNTDDGGRLFINNKLVSNNDGGHGAQDARASIFLPAGQHLMRFQNVQGGGGYQARLFYSGPDQPTEAAIPFLKLSQIAASTVTLPNAVIVNSSATIDTTGGASISPVNFGSLTLSSGTLSVIGKTNSTVRFASTALNGGNISRTNNVSLGQLSGSSAVTIAGPGQAILEHTASANTNSGAINLNGGTLIVRGSTGAASGTNNPLGNSTLNLGNQTAALFDARVGGVTYPNAISVTGNSTLFNFTNGQTTTFSGPITLNSGAKFTVNSISGGNSLAGATTKITGKITGPGNLLITSTQANNTAPNANIPLTIITNSSNDFTGTTSLFGGRLQLPGNVPSGSNGLLGNATTPVVVGNFGVGPNRPLIFDYMPTNTNTLSGNLKYLAGTGADLNTASGNVLNSPSNPTNFMVLWQGELNVTSAGDYTFGTNSDDGSVVYIDLNGDGLFTPDELIVDNLVGQGLGVSSTRIGSVNLPVGSYPVAIGLYQGGGGTGIEAKYGTGKNTPFSSLTTLNPSAPVSGTNFTGGVLSARWFNKAGGAADFARYMDTDLQIDGDFTFARNVLVPNSRNNSIILSNTGSGTTGSTFSGDITNNRGTTTAGGQPVFLNAATGRTLTFSGVLTAPSVNVVVGGVNNFTLNSAGTVIFTNTNTYTGQTTINATSTLNVGSGGTSGTIGNNNAGNVTLLGTLNLNRSDTAPVFSGLISGVPVGSGTNILTGTLNHIGSGTSILSGENTYAGNTNVNAGTLQIGNGGITGKLGLGTVTIASGATLTFNRTADVTMNNLFKGSGAINQVGSAKVTLTNPFSSTTGVINIPNGTLASASPGALGTSTVNNSSTLQVGSYIPAGTSQIGFGGDGTGFTLNGGATVSSNILTITTATSNLARSILSNSLFETKNFVASFQYNNPTTTTVGADGFAFVLTAPGVPAATVGSSGGSLGYAGTNNFNNGSIAIGLNTFRNTSPRGLRPGINGVFASSYTAASGPTPIVIGNGTPINFNISFNAATQVLTIVGTQGTLTSTWTFTLDLLSFVGPQARIGFTGGTGSESVEQTISNFSFNSVPATPSPATYSNNVVIPASATGNVKVLASVSQPTITMAQLSLPGTTNTLNVSAATGTPANLAYGLTFGQTNISGTDTLSIANNGTGIGTLTLGALNDAATPATLNLNGPGTVVLGTSALSIVNGTAVNLAGSVTVESNNSTALGNLAAVNVASGSTLKVGASQTLGSLTGNGSATLNGNTLTVGSTNNLSGTFAGVISDGTSSGNLVTAGTGTFTLTGTNTYTGTTTINAGTLQIGNGGTTGTLGSGGVTNNAALVFNRSDSYTVANAISGTGTLTQAGTGTTILTATNTYSGTTTVNAGTLLVNGTNSGSGAVNVNSGGLLGGTGSIAGGVTVNTGGSITGGTLGGVGTLTVGSLTFNGGTFQADFLNNTSDTIKTAGTVNVNAGTAGVFNVNSQSGTTSAANVFTLINNTGTGAITNTPLTGAPEAGTATINGKTGYFSYVGGDGNNFTLTIAGPPVLIGAGNLEVRQIISSGKEVIQLLQGTSIIDSRPLDSIVGVYTVNGSAGDDTLTINYSTVAPATGYFQRDITFNAGAGDDTMHIVSGTFGTTVYNYTNANDGNVQNYQLPGMVTLLNTITYTGLTPLTNSGTVADIIFNLPAAASNAFLQDSGTQLKLFSSPATFENTTFTPATNSTTINRGNAADQLTIGTVTNLVNTLTVGSSGNNFAEITQNGAISLVAGKTLTYWADQINLGNNITTTGGNINLNGTTKTVLTNSVVIDSANGAATGGNVLFNTPNVFTNGTGKDLTITTASTTGGNVTFTGLIEGVASDRSDLINDLLINTKSTTGADGTINFTSTGGVSIFVQSTASDQGSITLQGDVRLSSVATFDSGNNQPGSISSGTIDLSQSQISGTVAGVNLQLFSNTYGGGTGPSGDISLGHFGNAGGHKLVVAEAFAQKNTGSAAGNVSINLGRTSNTTPTSAGEVTGNFLAWGGIITSNTNLTADTFAIVASTKIVDGNGSAVNFTGNKLQLRSAGAGQPIDLQTDVNVIAAKAAGDITLTNSKFLTIDKLTYTATDLPPSSFTTNGIEALGQTVDLTAPGITQTTDGVIKSAHLRLQGTGNFTLDKSNEVSTFAANVTVNLSLKTITPLTIGTVLGTDGVTVNSGNFNLVVDGTGNDLAINKAVSVPTGSITMDVYGSINSNSSGSITGKNNVSLTFGQNGSDNTFNAAITSANDAVSLTGVAGVTKITTNAAVTAGAGQLLSVTTPAGNDQLTFNSTLTGGSIQVQTNAGDDSITFNGNVTAGAGTITISSGANDDTITVNATISATVTALIDGGTGTDVVTILGTGGNDTFDINKTFAKTALVRGGKFEYANVEVMNLNTGAGKDIFEIGFGTYAGAAGFLPATVNILAGADDDAATIYMPAGHNNTAGTWAKINWLDSSAAVRGGETVTYTPALEQLTIQGNTGRDWFFARPSTTAKVTKITINGDLPTSATPPGDRLQLDVSGLTAGIDTTHAKIPNGKLTGTAISQINWTGIESLPVPLGLGGSFDLGRTISPAPGHHSPIQETGTGINADPLPSPNNEAVSWLGVDASETFAGNGNIYGWDVATQSFVRYTNDPIHNQSLPPGPNRDLLQDGHYWPSGLANKRNFQVAVAPGGEVWVTVFVGDQAPLGGTKGEVWIEGTKYDSFNVPNGKFYTGRFLVADAGGDGVLNISIYQPMLDSWSLLNGIDVRPSDWVATITLTRQDGDPNPVAADGFTIDKYNFTNAQPNQVFTVTATLGKLVNGDGTPLTDVDPSLNGLQIQANALGQGFFHLMRPGTGSNSSFLNLVSAYGDAALNVGGIFQPFQQQYFSSSTPTPSAPSFKFDFDSAITKVTQTDYTPVYFNTLYGGMNAFGWASNSSNFDRTNASTPFNGTTKSLNRDGHMQSVSNTFTVNTGTPNKTYSVTVYLGEPANVARRGMTVSVSTGTMIGGTPTFVSGSSPTAFVLDPALPYTPAVGSGTAYFTATQTYVVSPTVGGTVGLTFQATTNSAGLLGLTFGLYSGVSGWWNLQGIEMTPVSPLVPMGGPSLGSAERLSNGPALQSIIGEAISRWAGAGLSAAQLAKLQSVRVEVANLPGGELGVHSPGRITLDDDGAGRGWFVDPTPSMDEEFGGGFSVATGRYDLLSVIMHELGHELGLTDRPRAGAPTVMTENLGLGERRSPTSAEVSELVELRVAEEEFVPLTVVKPGKVHGPAPAPGFNFVTGLPDEELSLLGVKVR